MSEAARVLEVRAVSKAFPGVQALDRVDLELEAGQIHALMGENGAGKSTLIKVLTGVHQQDSGVLRLRGQEVGFANPRAATVAGISAVHQERNLISRFSIGENIMLERLPASRGFVDYKAVHAEARRWLETLDLDLDPRLSVDRLSVAQIQLVEIAKALALEADILLMDEPTASITPHETDHLFGLLRQLRDRGVALVFVSHKLEEVFDLCDQITILRDGKTACASRPLEGLGRGDVVRFMIGRDEQAARLSDRVVNRDTTPALSLRGLASPLGHAALKFDLYKSEILGLYGLVGSGRTELAKVLLGIYPATEGEVLVDGQVVRIKDAPTALRQHRIGYVSEDRKREGLILIHGVARNIAVTIWSRLTRALSFLSPGREANAVMPYIDRLDVRTPSLGQTVMNLSGGNQQKVSVAKWLAADVSILIVDEPTVGIDIRTKAYLHELIGELASEGRAILLISSDMPELVGLADRILVMQDFRIVGEVENDHNYGRMSEAIMGHIHGEDENDAVAAS
ncbi:MAG: sugar ABC transporter ATP-binding protein [Pseudomonadota bacterium]